MFKEKVVIVVGAGASFDNYGLPLGGALASKIANDANFYFSNQSYRPSSGDADFFENVLWRPFHTERPKLNSYTEAGHHLTKALSSTISVDDALYQLSENPAAVQLGKMLIMRNIQTAEGDSTLKIDARTGEPDGNAGREGWIEQVFSNAITNLKQSEIGHAFDNVTFVIFNYDRCVEHYIYWSLQRIGLGASDAAEVVQRLDIVRPYGSLGSIVPSTPNFLQFGDKRYLDYFMLIDRIRTFTESQALHDRDLLAGKLSDARLILFLGFGFHPQNMALLGLDKPHPVKGSKILATTCGVDDANIPELRGEIAKRLRISRDAVETYPMTASDILKKLRIKITLLVN